MAFQENNTVNSHKHLVDLLETFLATQGWTIDASLNAAERELYVSQVHGGETFYFSVKSTGASSLVLRANLAYPESGSCTPGYMNLKSTAMVRAWFFAGDLWCYLVVEVAAGYFQMAFFGRLAPYGAFSAGNKEGAFCFAGNNTAWSSLSSYAGREHFSLFYDGSGTGTRVRHVPAAGPEWGDEASAIAGYNVGGYPYRESWMISELPNSNGERPMIPVRIALPNNPAVPSGYNNYYPLGFLPGLRLMAFKNVVNASEQTIGADVWKRFPPPHQNVAVAGMAYPGTEIGFAFLK